MDETVGNGSDAPSLRESQQAALEADIRGRISFEVYCFIGDARSSMHELHRAAELSALQSEWLAKYMAAPDEMNRIGGRFLDDAISTANRAIALLHQAKAHHDNMVAEANRLAALVQKARKDGSSPQITEQPYG